MISDKKRVKRQIEGMMQAFESCNRFMAYLNNKYKFTEEEKETLHKLQYQLGNLNKSLKLMREG